MLELWGLGDTVLALPFLRAAAARHQVTLLAPARSLSLLRRFAPSIDCIPFRAPWTSARDRYRLAGWPWRNLWRVTAELRTRDFDVAFSARSDPRDHLWLRLSGARRRVSATHPASARLLTDPLTLPARTHRADAWTALSATLGLDPLPSPGRLRPPQDRLIVAHLGAGSPHGAWPKERWTVVIDQLRRRGWSVVVLDDSLVDLDRLIEALAPARAFLGNDSGPGHLAAFLGVPTFTIFGPGIPELAAPRHPFAAWQQGGPCPHKPCRNACHYAQPHCLLSIDPEPARHAIEAWLATLADHP